MTSTPQSSNSNINGFAHLPDMVEGLFRDGVMAPVPGGIRSNLLESWGSLWLQLALPGVDIDSLKVQVIGRKLLVNGKTRIPPVEAATYIRHDLPSEEI